MDATASVAASPARPRPWYRLHLSTYIVLLIPLSALVLVAVPGYTVFRMPVWWGGATRAGIYTYQEHGWPLVYMDRKVVTSFAPPQCHKLAFSGPLDEEFRSATSLRWATKTGTLPNWASGSPGWRRLGRLGANRRGGDCPQGGPGDQSPRGRGHLRRRCRALRVVAAAVLPVQPPRPAGAVRGRRRRLRLLPVEGERARRGRGPDRTNRRSRLPRFLALLGACLARAAGGRGAP